MARKKTISDLPKNWQEDAINAYKEGASDVEIRAYVLDGISDDLWYRLIKEDETFARTIKKGKLFSQAWWEKQGRTNLKNREFNPTTWYMNMKNRFGWRDKTEQVESTGDDNNLRFEGWD